MRPEVLHLDLDGVIVDLHGPLLEAFDLPASKAEQITDWGTGLVDLFEAETGRPWTLSEIWYAVDEKPFWDDLPVHPWAEAVLQAIERTGIPYVIVTKPTGYPYCAAGKTHWLKRRMPAARYVLTNDKTTMVRPGSVLIDDAPPNVKAYRAAGGRACLFPRTWNRHGYNPSPSQAEAFIEALAK